MQGEKQLWIYYSQQTKEKIARQPTLTSQKFYYSSSILRHHVALLIDTFACLILGIDGEKSNGGGDVAEGRRVPSLVHLNRSCVSSPGPPVVRPYCGERGKGHGGGREEGRRECRGRVWSAPSSLPRGSVVLISVRISNLSILSS